MNLNPHYILAIEASVKAGVAIKNIYKSKDYQIEIKDDNSPVTLADKTSSAIIESLLRQTNIPVIDEEHCCPSFSIRQSWKNLWLVDPMDGTKEFISGNGEFTVNIALIEEKKPIFGVIYAPVTGELYWGGKSTGSYKALDIYAWDDFLTIEKAAIKLQPNKKKGETLRIAASRSHLDNNTKNFIGKLEKQFGEILFTSKGSSLKLCMIAEGLTDVYPRFSRTMEWDTAAGHAIASGTQGVLLRQLDSLELEYNKEDLSNPPFYALSGLQREKGLNYF
jgi:3'(2'), 5'-bisphosphate nucleotidase